MAPAFVVAPFAATAPVVAAVVVAAIVAADLAATGLVPGFRVVVVPLATTPGIGLAAGFVAVVAGVGFAEVVVAVGFAVVVVAVGFAVAVVPAGRVAVAVAGTGRRAALAPTVGAVGVGIVTGRCDAVVNAGLVAGFAVGRAAVAFAAVAIAPDSRVVSVTRVELEPPARVARNDQPGFADCAVASACFAGWVTAGVVDGLPAFAGMPFGVGVADGIADALGPEETTGLAAVVRSMRSAWVSGAGRAAVVGFVAVPVTAVVFAAVAVLDDVVVPGRVAVVTVGFTAVGFVVAGAGTGRRAATVTP